MILAFPAGGWEGDSVGVIPRTERRKAVRRI